MKDELLNREVSITLKEIIDMLGVDHSKSMNKTEKLSMKPSFGVLRKTRITSTEKGGKPQKPIFLIRNKR
jgi:hypothetical protein